MHLVSENVGIFLPWVRIPPSPPTSHTGWNLLKYLRFSSGVTSDVGHVLWVRIIALLGGPLSGLRESSAGYGGEFSSLRLATHFIAPHCIASTSKPKHERMLSLSIRVSVRLSAFGSFVPGDRPEKSASHTVCGKHARMCEAYQNTIEIHHSRLTRLLRVSPSGQSRVQQG